MLQVQIVDLLTTNPQIVLTITVVAVILGYLAYALIEGKWPFGPP